MDPGGPGRPDHPDKATCRRVTVGRAMYLPHSCLLRLPLQWSRHHTGTLISHVASISDSRVRSSLISIWYCKWFMLPMTLDMPDEGTR